MLKARFPHCILRLSASNRSTGANIFERMLNKNTQTDSSHFADCCEVTFIWLYDN